MAAKQVASKERYPFQPEFEVVVGYALATSQRFYEAIGHAIDPERVASPDLQLIIKTVRQYALRTGAHSLSRLLVEQQLKLQYDAGKVTHEQVQNARRMLDLAEDVYDVPEIDALIEMTTQSIRKVVEMEAVDALLKSMPTGIDEKVIDRFDRVISLGKVRSVVTIGSLSASTEDLKKAVAPIDPSARLPTGIAELDALLNGGMEKKALGMVQAGTGGGKSLFLCHIAAQALLDRRNVLYVSLELSEEEIKKRIYCNLCDMTAEHIIRKPDEASRRYSLLESRGLGRFGVVYQTPLLTTVTDIRKLVKRVEQEWEAPVPLLIVDEASKVVQKLGGERRSYDEMRYVFLGLRAIAEERDSWIWTASQVKSGFEGKKRYGTDAGADSAEKARIADVGVELPRTQEDMSQGMIRMRVFKRRVGESYGEIGPVPLDAAYGRITTVNDRQTSWGVGV